MKRRSRLLKTVALESLTLAVEVFNRPSPTARTQGVLLNLQHSFEMLLKAIIWDDRKRIQAPGEDRAYSFRDCVGIVRGMGHLSEDETVVAFTIAGHRDGVQHQGAAVSEERLYVDAASGLRLFDDLLHRGFGERLADHPDFSNRMLPITANPPRELHVLTGRDVDRVRELLRPGRRRRAEALALLRTLVVSDQVARDPDAGFRHPSSRELDKVAKRLVEGEAWEAVLPGLARLSLEHDEGNTYRLRMVKEPTAPGVRVVKPGEPGAEDAATILKTSELEHWCFYLHDLAEKAGVSRYEALSLVYLLGIKDDAESFRMMSMGKQQHQRYSGRALKQVREAVAAGRVEEARGAWRERLRAKRAEKSAAKEES